MNHSTRSGLAFATFPLPPALLEVTNSKLLQSFKNRKTSVVEMSKPDWVLNPVRFTADA